MYTVDLWKNSFIFQLCGIDGVMGGPTSHWFPMWSNNGGLQQAIGQMGDVIAYNWRHASAPKRHIRVNARPSIGSPTIRLPPISREMEELWRQVHCLWVVCLPLHFLSTSLGVLVASPSSSVGIVTCAPGPPSSALSDDARGGMVSSCLASSDDAGGGSQLVFRCPLWRDRDVAASPTLLMGGEPGAEEGLAPPPVSPPGPWCLLPLVRQRRRLLSSFVPRWKKRIKRRMHASRPVT